MSTAYAAQALAAEAAGGHAEAFYEAPEFWVMVAFVIIVAAAGKAVFTIATKALDERAQGISNQIEQATKLREDAQDLLASYERQHRDALKEAEEIVTRARAEAERLSAQAAEALKKALKRREQMAMERIAQAEANALGEVRSLTVDVAIEAARRVLADKVTGKKADALVEASIKELVDKLH